MPSASLASRCTPNTESRAEVFQHVSDAVNATISHAADEAARRGDRRIGTDHLLLGLLHDQAIAERLGAGIGQARIAAWELDRAALEAVGVDLDAVPVSGVPRGARHAPPTSGMRATMARAVAIAKDEHARTVEPDHLLQALLDRERPDAAAILLHALGIRPGSPATNPSQTQES
jgi:ATP-dependent Clp protease ATP-binding subunit ClpA